MALIVKSSIDILPWTEIEKQKLIEDKKEFLNKNEEIKEVPIEKAKELNNSKNSKESGEKTKSSKNSKQDNKKEVKK